MYKTLPIALLLLSCAHTLTPQEAQDAATELRLDLNEIGRALDSSSAELALADYYLRREGHDTTILRKALGAALVAYDAAQDAVTQLHRGAVSYEYAALAVQGAASAIKALGRVAQGLPKEVWDAVDKASVGGADTRAGPTRESEGSAEADTPEAQPAESADADAAPEAPSED